MRDRGRSLARFGTWVAGALALTVFVPLLLVEEGQASRRPPMQSSMAYVLGGERWIEFLIPPGQSALKVVTNASVVKDGSTAAQMPLFYTLEYRILGAADDILKEGHYNQRSHASAYVWEATGELIAACVYLGEPMVPLDSRMFLIDLEEIPFPPERLALRLSAAQEPITDVAARVYFNHCPPPFKLRYLWQRMPRQKKERLARGNIYTMDLLTAGEKQSLLENRWAALAPRGIGGIHYRERKVYWVDSQEVSRSREAIVPQGLFADQRTLGVIPLPEGSACVRLEIQPLEGEKNLGSQEVHLAWYGRGASDEKHATVPLEGNPTVHEEDYPGGVLEIYSPVPVVARAFLDSFPVQIEITPESSLVPAYLVGKGQDLDFGAGNHAVAPTALRLDLRRLAPAGALAWATGISLDYQLLDDAGRVLSRGRLRHDEAWSSYDTAVGPRMGHRPSESSRFHFWLPPGCARIRLGCDEGEALVSGYTAVNGLSRRVRAPEDYLPFEKRQDEYGSWFLIKPENYVDCVRQNREVFLKLQARPPVVPRDLVEGNYHAILHHPEGTNPAYKVLAPLEEAETTGRAFAASSFRELAPGKTVSLQLRGEPGQAAIAPRLLCHAGADGPFTLRLHVDGRLRLEEVLASRTSEIRVPPLRAGVHSLKVETGADARVYINSVVERAAGLLERVVYRLEGEGLTYHITKESGDRETLSLRVYSRRGLGRCRLRAKVKGPSRDQGPFASWTFEDIVYDIREPAGRPLRLMGGDEPPVEGGEILFLSLGADLKPGPYEVHVSLEQGSPCFIHMVQIIPGRVPTRRLLFEESLVRETLPRRGGP